MEIIYQIVIVRVRDLSDCEQLWNSVSFASMWILLCGARLDLVQSKPSIYLDLLVCGLRKWSDQDESGPDALLHVV